MSEKKDRLYLMRDEKVEKALIKLAIPSILTALVGTIYNIIDTIYIGILDNAAMIAATTVALPLIVIVQSIGDAIGVSSSNYVSRQLGKQEYESSKITVQTAITLSLVLGIIVCAIMLLFLPQLLNLLNNESSVYEFAYPYTAVLLIGGVTLIIKQVASSILRSEGDIKFPMIAILIGVVANIILDPIFMFEWGLNLKVVGAAWATVIAQTISACLMIHRICTKSKYTRWKFGSFKLDKSAVKEIISLGSAVFARQSLPSISYGVFASSCALFGTTFLASMGIAKKSLHFATFALIGFAQGFQPFVAYNYGAKNYQRLKKSIKLALIITTVYCIAFTLIFVLFSPQVIGIFMRNTEIVYFGKFMLWGYALSLPILGYYQIWAVCLQSLGKSKESMFLSISRQGLFYVPMIFFLPRLLGELGIYLAQPVADWLTIIALLILSRDIRKEIKLLSS